MFKAVDETCVWKNNLVNWTSPKDTDEFREYQNLLGKPVEMRWYSMASKEEVSSLGHKYEVSAMSPLFGKGHTFHSELITLDASIPGRCCGFVSRLLRQNWMFSDRRDRNAFFSFFPRDTRKVSCSRCDCRKFRKNGATEQKLIMNDANRKNNIHPS